MVKRYCSFALMLLGMIMLFTSCLSAGKEAEIREQLAAEIAQVSSEKIEIIGIRSNANEGNLNFDSYGATLRAVADTNILFGYDFKYKGGKLEFDAERFNAALVRKKAAMMLTYSLINRTEKAFETFQATANETAKVAVLSLALEEQLTASNKQATFDKLQGIAFGMENIKAPEIELMVTFFDSLNKQPASSAHPHYTQNINQDLNNLAYFRYALLLKKDSTKNGYAIHIESLRFFSNNKMNDVVQAAFEAKVGKTDKQGVVRFDNMREEVEGSEIDWQPFTIQFQQDGKENTLKGQFNIYTDEIIWEE